MQASLDPFLGVLRGNHFVTVLRIGTVRLAKETGHAGLRYDKERGGREVKKVKKANGRGESGSLVCVTLTVRGMKFSKALGPLFSVLSLLVRDCSSA